MDVQKSSFVFNLQQKVSTGNVVGGVRKGTFHSVRAAARLLVHDSSFIIGLVMTVFITYVAFETQWCPLTARQSW